MRYARRMNTDLPSPEEVRAALAPLTLKQLDELEQLSGVAATTIYKIQRGETGDPRLGTARKILPFIRQVVGAEAPSQPAQAASSEG